MKSLYSVLIFIITLLNTTVGFSQWKWIHPTPTGEFYQWCKYWDANTWYIAGFNGTFIKTTNAGTSWFVNLEAGILDIYDGYSNIRNAHFFDRDNGIIVCDDGALRTSNGGTTFEVISSSALSSSVWQGIFFLNSSTGYVCASSGSNRLSKTTDGGITWNSIVIPSAPYYDVFSPDDTLIMACSNLGRIQRSSDGGSSWEQINTSGSFFYGMEFYNKDTGFVVGSGNTILLTTNAGMNWTDKSPFVSASWRQIILKETNGVKEAYVCGGDNFVIKSTDLGVSWDTIRVTLPDQFIINDGYASSIQSFSMSQDGDTILTAGYSGFLNLRYGDKNIISLLKGARFGDFSTYQSANGIYADSIGLNIWVVGYPQDSLSSDQVLYSSDGGNSWVAQYPVGSHQVFIDIFMLDNSIGYIVGNAGHVYKTINGGSDWNPVTFPTNLGLNSVSFVNENTGWVLGEGTALYKTTDGGNSWHHQVSSLNNVNLFGIHRSNIKMLNENTGWAVGGVGFGSGRVCKTTNGGLNWDTQVQTDSGYILDFEIIDLNTAYYCRGTNGAIKRTSDGGNTWFDISVPLSVDIFNIDFINDMHGMFRTFSTICKTSDGGNSWGISYVGATSNYPGLAMVSDTLSFATGYNSGVFRYGDALVNITQWFNTTPEEFELSQNYPNPFNPTTTIQFAIPRSGKVSLKIYDITGREIAVLINEMDLNPGTVKQTFDGNGLASGVYFYSLFIDGSIAGTKKMVLVK